MNINELIDLAKNEKNQINETIIEFNDIYVNLKNIVNPSLLNTLNNSYKYELNKKIQEYNHLRKKIAIKNKNILPKDLTTTFVEGKNFQYNIITDDITKLNNIFYIKMKEIKKYLNENELSIFPYELLKNDKKQLEVNQLINNKDIYQISGKNYVMTSIHNMDIFKILNGYNLNLNECIFSHASEQLIHNFLFQLPILKSLDLKIQQLQDKSHELEKNIKELVNQQFNINMQFNEKINKIFYNLNQLNDESYNMQEKERKKNPTMLIEDLNTTIVEPVYKKISRWYSDYDQEVLDGFHSYHPLITVMKPETIKNEYYPTSYIKNINITNITQKDITKEDIKKQLQNENLNNFTLFSIDDITNLNESCKLLCYFGSGYSDFSKLNISNTNNQIKLKKPI